jgi:serine/threonine-protein kinase
MVVVGLVATAGAFAAYFLDPDRPVKEAHRRLARGEAVTLIGETGPPRWSRWCLGQGGSPEEPYNDPTFAIQCYDTALLELLPAPLPERYILRAQVRHLRSAEGGAGIYFGYRKHETSHGVEHTYCRLSFADVGARANQLRTDRRAGRGANLGEPQRFNTVCLSLRYFRERGPMPQASGHTDTRVKKSYPPPDQSEGPPWPPWRNIAVRVTPDSIEPLWGDDERIGKLAPSARILLAKHILEVDESELDPTVEYGPGGGLGLVVEQGVASFRHVVIEPLFEPR